MRHNIPFRIVVQPNIYLHLVIMLFVFPLTWVVAWSVAIVFHEFGHYFAIKIFKGKIDSIEIGFGGLRMQCSMLDEWKNIVSILCGPLFGFSLVLIGEWFPKVAVCSCILTLYNMLPILPLDGGRVLHILIGNNLFFEGFEKTVLLILFAGALYCCFSLHLGVIPVLIVIALWSGYRKIPCKDSVYKVQ